MVLRLYNSVSRSAIHRNLALILLFAIFSLNLYIFLTLQPSSRSDVDVYPKDLLQERGGLFHRSQAVSHLQFPRKRLNKSNYTSDSLGADRGAGAAVWEEGGKGQPPRVREGQRPRGGKKNEDLWEKREGDSPDLRPDPDFKREPRKGMLEEEQEDEDGEAERRPGGVPHDPREGFEDRGEGGEAGEERGDDPSRNIHLVREEEKVEEAAGKKAQEKKRKSKGRGDGGFVKNFTDPRVDSFIQVLEKKGLLDLLVGEGLQENYWAFLKRQRLRRQPGLPLPAYRSYRAKTNWERFHKGIRQHFLYDPDSPVMTDLMDDLTNRKIVDVEQKEGGTQIKLIIGYDNAGQALFKPMRFPRETETLPDHFYFADYERHVAEIAAFHLDRVLGYNRVPPTVGRLVNMTRDIRDLADEKLARTFFISPAGNLCFHGSCSYYCDSSHPVCGHPNQLEASLMAFLPSDTLADRLTWRNPWKRSYSKRRKAYWEAYDDLCEKIRRRPPYSNGRRLLDIIDMSVLDFLMGNLDRHHYETFQSFGNDTFILHLDNGRGFGKQHQDDLSCLAPLVQCCMIRLSTLQRLVRLYGGSQPLSLLMKMSLSSDQVSPVLIEGHLQALDRRLLQVLQALRSCLYDKERTLSQVIVDDGVY